MEKIASPQKLASEIQRLVTYARSPNPSRERLASDLKALADRIAFPARSGPAFGDEDWEPTNRQMLRRYHNTLKRAEQTLTEARQIALAMGFPDEKKEGNEMNPAGALAETLHYLWRTKKCNIYHGIE